ncbi:3-isopropylmalate dehydratase small subunit [Terrilactibacillus sp. BCM23-1]|uniref:3-isopropylmalate dehydratase small subunit n=1 Tax=Terrilactibacillus tamarindi TaxID=2599694 RepID=A0A6N8CNR7_9BACI|nr:3-isopropylmalate dehydratase small subunit [Terrilactibacillus tamarindi]MTT30753.1 3-isopropylmalate dehydratase small subunit [Terrilactibacillus tamarindi]
MEPFKKHRGLVCPLDRRNVDTDQIIPKQFLKRIERQGFGECLFYHWRFDDEGNKKQDFVLNKEKYKGASILIAGENFGCGSSREHAPWALGDYGFKVIIAPSFADIFYNNCQKNGLLLIKLDEDNVKLLMQKAQQESFYLDVDLVNQVVVSDGLSIPFDIDAYQKKMLLEGLDEIAVTLKLEDEIRAYEQTR